MKIWIATDPKPLLSGGYATLLFSGGRPRLENGFWMQGKWGNRWPITNILKQKPGDITQVEIKGVEE
jgi:hypothetical protein